jgi:hypothetical protein
MLGAMKAVRYNSDVGYRWALCLILFALMMVHRCVECKFIQ